MGWICGHVGERLDVWRPERSAPRKDGVGGFGFDGWNGLDEFPWKMGMSPS